MLFGKSGANELGNSLAGKRINRSGDGIISAGNGSKGSSIKKF